MDHLSKNAKLFIWFRVLFHCRFYYPVLAVLFLDLGLTISQYVILNGVWALTIVLLEVPSGALADLIGRKRMLVSAAALMMAEMALLLFAPIGGGGWLFAVCILNRILAGMAEAASSGADEALAYDSLAEEKRDSVWDEVLARLGRRRSLGMAVAMILGAAVYDRELIVNVGAFLGLELSLENLSQGLVIKLPIWLCFLQAACCFWLSLRFDDIEELREDKTTEVSQWTLIMRQTWSSVLWIVTQRSVLLLICGALIVDMFVRNFATLSSQFYRFLGIPEYGFGLCGCLVALSLFLVPYFAKRSVRKYGVRGNLVLVFLLAAAGLSLLALLRGPLGVLGAVVVMMSISYSTFVVSKFLNQQAPSRNRATILSVKGLFFNLGYAVFSVGFAQVMSWNVERFQVIDVDQAPDHAFESVLKMTPLVFLAVVLSYAIVSYCLLWNRGEKALS